MIFKFVTKFFNLTKINLFSYPEVVWSLTIISYCYKKYDAAYSFPGNQHAGLIREVWYNIPGYAIEDLTSNANFPARPSSTEVLDKFDAPFNYDDNYGSRISGYFHAPETGDYRQVDNKVRGDFSITFISSFFIV